MQLKNKVGAGNLRTGLIAAACALLSPAIRAQAPAAGDVEATQVDTGLLFYQEDADRVRNIGAVVKLTHDFGDERVVGATLAIDSLTGGSPNGAIASNSAQTFATPSSTNLSGIPGPGDDDKSALYTIAAGKQPLDTVFHDTRVAADLNWSQPLGIGNKMSVGGHFSGEFDFLSVSGNAAFSRDFNDKNTSLSLGASAEFDQIKPVGGAPVPGSVYSLQQKTAGDESKNVLGTQFGITQVLARNWVAQINLSMDRATGYLNDPYKILSRVAGTGAVSGYQFESRPDSRTRSSIYVGNKVALGRQVLDLSFRYGTDDWGINSSTIEAHYRIALRGAMYIEPQLRWYQQGAADFYRLYLTSADATTGPMSSDPRLADFTATTMGLKFGMPLANGDELSLRLVSYQQDAKQHTSSLSALTGLDLNPRLRAIVLQLGWRFGL
jgi:hypothetical protein